MDFLNKQVDKASTYKDSRNFSRIMLPDIMSAVQNYYKINDILDKHNVPQQGRKVIWTHSPNINTHKNSISYKARIV